MLLVSQKYLVVRAYDTCGNFSDTTRLHNSINLSGVLDACAHYFFRLE